MPGPILHAGAVVMCAHAGQATPLTPNPLVLVSGQPVVTLASPWQITGCALSSTSAPPCLMGQFIVGSVNVTVSGSPLALLTGTSTCVPTGTPMLPVSAQVIATAT
ncbi:MAG: hypothetical protein QOC63_1035 [Mycobacterium sp.]|nr:hypothetical protein [Mycobacterium sp.]